MRQWCLLAAGVLVAACGGGRTGHVTPPGEGHLAVPGGRIWYKVSGTGRGTPVVLLHGGPGFSSFYLKPFEDLGDDRVVVRYDQLGGGKSDTTSDTTAFTIAHFVRELDSLRSHLGVERWHVLGHSWGTILALEYYRAHPDRVASLTFGSPVFDIPAYERRARQLLATLSDSAQRAVRRAEATRRYDTPAYQNAINEFYGLYLFRHPVQADLDSSFASFNEKIYEYMQGPSEFTITGTLKHYAATSFLPQVRVPSLLTVGEFDEVGPELVREHSHLIPGARLEVMAGSAHLTPWDARDANVQVVRAFLRGTDSTSARHSMNPIWIVVAALAALVGYFAVGGIFFTIPAMRAEFAKYPAVYRTGAAINSVMAVGMLGILLAIGAAAVIFARIHPAGAGIEAGIKFGVVLAVFQLGSFVLHNHMNLNIGWRLSTLQGIVYTAEWIVVGVVISLVYRG